MEPTKHPLKQIALFSELSASTLARIANVAIRRTYAEDESISVEGERYTSAYFLTSGEVGIFRIAPSGREQVLVRLGAGKAFNVVPAFQPESTNHASARALSEVTLYAVLADDLQRLIAACPDLGVALLWNFAGRLAHLTDMVESLALYSVRGRLARFLLDQADAGPLAQRWTQSEIASYLGTVREMVSRILRAFVDAGLIRIERSHIVLLDREALENEALS